MYLEGTESITSGTTSVAVVFASSFDAVPLHVQPFVRNTSADATKRAIIALVTAVDEDGFTVQLSQATNTANYELVWHAGDTASILNSGEPLQGQALARAMPAGAISALRDFRIPILTPDNQGKPTLRSLTSANFWQSIPFRAAIPSGPLAAGRDKSLNLAIDNNWLYVGLQDRWARIPLDNGMNWDRQPYFVPFREAEVDVTYVADQVEHTFAFPTPFSAGELPRVLFTLTNTAAGPIDLLTATITETTLNGFTLTFSAAPTADVQVYYMARQMRSNPSLGDAGSPENLVEALQDEVDALELVVDALGDDVDTAEADIVALQAAGNPDLVSQAEAEAGVATTIRAWTALRVRQAINVFVDSAPGVLDTLNELAAALGDDANFATTVTNSLAGKEPTQTAASQAEMEAGSSTALRSTTPQRIRQAQAKSQTVSLASLGTATAAGDLPLWNEIIVSLTGDLTLLAPTSPQAMQKIIYLLTASGGARTLTLNAAIKTPTGSAFSGAIASGSTRLLELTYITNRWAVTSNLEFVA